MIQVESVAIPSQPSATGPDGRGEATQVHTRLQKLALGIEDEPETENTMSKTKTAKKIEAAAEPKAEKKAREPKPKVELRTLALRVTEEEFRLVHEAAGPRGLTAMMRTAILNAASKAVVAAK